MAFHDLGQFGLYRLVHVTAVPDQAQSPVLDKHAMDLGQSIIAAEPVKSLADGNGTSSGVRQGNLLRGPFQNLGGGDDGAEHFPHPFHRLDGDNARTGGEQETGQFARPGGQVDDGGTAVYVQ